MLVPIGFEARGFIMLCLAGAACALGYDVLKIIFAPLEKRSVFTVLRVFLTCTLWAFVLSFTAMLYNHARLRYFMPLALFLGAVVWIFSVGRIFSAVFSYIWKLFLKICGIIFKILLTPLQFLHKIIMIPLGMVGSFLCKLKARLSVCVGRIVDEQREKAKRRRRKRNEKTKIRKKHARHRHTVRHSGTGNDNPRRGRTARHHRKQADNRRA
ncbi:MAG: spore cortex biosynthesis protein YabQ [Clostridia bacterium]|nr:spore cortex biosynthesis protein YabQ [Clostridia bacterium]